MPSRSSRGGWTDKQTDGAGLTLQEISAVTGLPSVLGSLLTPGLSRGWQSRPRLRARSASGVWILSGADSSSLF